MLLFYANNTVHTVLNYSTTEEEGEEEKRERETWQGTTLGRCITEFEGKELEQICVKGKNPLDIQQKWITPTNTVLRAATGILTTYMVDVAYHFVMYCTKILTVTAYFYPCTCYRVPAITGNIWMATDHEPTWSQL